MPASHSDLPLAFDYIVVGGGAAGCVLARRLAEDGAATVLLVEAGPSDDLPAIDAAGAWTSLLEGPHDWGYGYASGPNINGRAIPIPRGRVLGGSSSINAMLWYRGHPSDYAAWEAAGAEGWGWEAMLPYFCRSEDWQGGASRWRGVGGPMRIEQPCDPHPIATALLAGAADLGLPVIEDYNGPDPEGAALGQFNCHGDQRWSASRGYLRPAASWPNLTVLTGSFALDLMFAGARCVGLRHLVHGVPTRTQADREVILALGAFGTPHLLTRSGLADAGDLHRLGIPVRAALPGVGANLQDHPLLMGLNFRAQGPLGPVRGNGGGAILNWRSRAGLPAPDLHAFVVQGAHATPGVAAAHDVTGDVFAISPGLMRSKSTGFLRVDEPGPHGHLTIQPNFLAEPDDLAALMAGIDTIMDLAETPAFRALATGPAAPGHRLTSREKADFVRLSCSTFYHPCGTCTMGRGDMAVVDPQLRVRGIEALRVADAAVFPIIPSANTQASVIALAERAANLILGRESPL
jgi:choline dehydrogenase